MTDERAMRFGYLLSEIESSCRAILDGRVDNIPLAVELIHDKIHGAREIAREVSREALDKIGAGEGSRPSSPVAPDGPDWNVLPDLGLTRPEEE